MHYAPLHCHKISTVKPKEDMLTNDTVPREATPTDVAQQPKLQLEPIAAHQTERNNIAISECPLKRSCLDGLRCTKLHYRNWINIT